MEGLGGSFASRADAGVLRQLNVLGVDVDGS